MKLDLVSNGVIIDSTIKFVEENRPMGDKVKSVKDTEDNTDNTDNTDTYQPTGIF